MCKDRWFGLTCRQIYANTDLDLHVDKRVQRQKRSPSVAILERLGKSTHIGVISLTNLDANILVHIPVIIFDMHFFSCTGVAMHIRCISVLFFAFTDTCLCWTCFLCKALHCLQLIQCIQSLRNTFHDEKCFQQSIEYCAPWTVHEQWLGFMAILRCLPSDDWKWRHV